MLPLISIFVGAGLGAWLRWGLSVVLNPLLPNLPLGTLAANYLGGYLVGLAVAYFAFNANLAPELRLFAITGFLGGLTTFSTFSAEVVMLIERKELAWAFLTASLHLAGSLLLTFLGLMTARAMMGKS